MIAIRLGHVKGVFITMITKVSSVESKVRWRWMSTSALVKSI